MIFLRARVQPAPLMFAATWALTACYEGGVELQGLAPTNASDQGPTVVWDLSARPLPEIPFPNDVGTRPSTTSPTGKRINVSEEASTAFETNLRQHVNRLDGFSTTAPIWIPFDGRINVEEVYLAMTDGEPGNDPVYLINVDPASPEYGQAVPLDVGAGPPTYGGTRFPLVIQDNDQYFQHDPRAHSSNLLFEVVEEDLNGNGVLDRGEDTDGDGVLDHPNLWGELLGDTRLMDPYRHLISFYELETNTLILRPAMPLRELTRYAVVLTRRVRGDGISTADSPVRGPFPFVNHLQQTEALQPLVEGRLLEAHGATLDDVAFAWTFTTQSITKDLVAIREGLYGVGSLSQLQEDFPPCLTEIPEINDEPNHPNPYIYPVATLVNALNDPTLLALLAIPGGSAQELIQKYDTFVDYFIYAKFQSPQLIRTEGDVFQMDWQGGSATYGPGTVYLNCAVPKTRAGIKPPFPVVIYNHGSGSTRLEILGFAAALAEFGLAGCAIDSYGHGLLDSPEIKELAQVIVGDRGLQGLQDIALSGRATDLNNDGYKDSGGDFWTADMFHTRDATRQTVVDTMRLIRILRAFGTETMPIDIDGDGAHEIAGDFNGDGVHDLGGDVPYYMMGQSLGGIMTAITGAVDPALHAVAPIVAGAGLVDIAIRSMQTGMLEAVWLPVMGSLVVGTHLNGNIYQFSFNVRDVITERNEKFARAELQPGDEVEVVNLDNGESHRIVVPEGPGFRLRVPTTKGDRLELRLYRGTESAPFRVIDTFEEISGHMEALGWQGDPVAAGDTLRALGDGMGLGRGTPAMRRMVGVAQLIVDPADPANFARHFHEPLAVAPDGPRPKNVLVVNSVGDMNVPVNTGINLGRVAGFLGWQEIDPRYGKTQEQVLLDNWVVEGLEKLRRFQESPCHYDPRAVLFDADEPSLGLDPTRGPSLTQPVKHPDCRGSAPPTWCQAACPSLPPLRATVTRPWGTSGMRLLYQSNIGAHSFRLPDPTAPFDTARYQINQIGWYFATGGRELIDDVCLATAEGCPQFVQ